MTYEIDSIAGIVRVMMTGHLSAADFHAYMQATRDDPAFGSDMSRLMIVDIDSHMYERGDMWRTFCDPSDRGLALSIVEDELGYSWLVLGDRRIHLADLRAGQTV